MLIRSSKYLVALFLTAFLVFATSACSTSRNLEPLSEEVVSLFDADGGVIADLTEPGQGVEFVAHSELVQAAARAKAAGTDLRIVIVDKDSDLISAESVVAAYPGTALSFKANDPTWAFASSDISLDQLERAMQAATSQTSEATSHTSIADTALAFVEVIESEGIDRPSSLRVVLLAVAVVLAGAFFFWQLKRVFGKREREAQKEVDFDERRAALVERVGELRSDLDRVMIDGDDADRSQAREHDSALSAVIESVNASSDVLEIDELEIRLNQTATKVAELLEAVTDR